MLFIVIICAVFITTFVEILGVNTSKVAFYYMDL